MGQTDRQPDAPAVPETKLSREQVAWLEVGRTEIGHGMAVVVTVVFLAVIVAVPVSDAWLQRGGGEPVQVADILGAGPAIGAAWDGGEGGPVDRLFAANAEALKQITDFEDALGDASWLTDVLLGPVTQLQAGLLGAGNEEAYVGRDGWLFYRPGIDHLVGPGFLDADRLALRAAGGNEFTAPPQPDPRLAIVQMRDQLAARGIDLVVVPTPVKPAVRPDRFSGRFDRPARPLANRSFPVLVADLEAAGVELFDPGPVLAGHEGPAYLESDTHWTPEAMGEVAAALAARLGDRVRRGTAAYAAAEAEVRNLGDIAVMLKLPEDQRLYAPQAVTVRRIGGSDGADWQPTDGAEVLVLGDSFTNIYAMEGLNWGTDAGFAEQLAFELQAPVDRIAINAGGAHAARQALAGELARGHDRLANTKVVVWQFAMRELSAGDWKLMDLPVPPARVKPTPVAADGVEATATIVEVSDAPRPGSVPYRDAVISAKLLDVQGPGLPTEAVVYMWGLRDNRLVDQPWRAGRRLRLRLTPWAEAQKVYGSYNRFEVDDPDALFLDAYWAEVIE